MTTRRKCFLLAILIFVFCGLPAGAAGQKKLRIPFDYQGPGSEDQPVRYVMLRRGTEQRTASNVLINAINSLRLSFGHQSTLASGTTYMSDYQQLSGQQVQEYNQHNPTKTLPRGVIYGVQYQVSYMVESEQFSIDVSALLGRKAAGARTYSKYNAAYAGEDFTFAFSRAVETIFASGIFDRGDITDGRALVRRIVQHRDPVSNYIWSKAGDTQAALQHAAAASTFSETDWSTLVNLFNHIIYDPGFYDPQRFKGLNTSSELMTLIQRRDSFDLPFMNRSLLQAWYPNAIAINPKFRQLYRIGS